MPFAETLEKQSLETLIKKEYAKVGRYFMPTLLDTIKVLGFLFATNAGVSISIGDLKAIRSKKYLLQQLNRKQKEGLQRVKKAASLSALEHYDLVVENWGLVNSQIKTRVRDYFTESDPLNNLFLMASSGARGNWDQVQQLVGTRGFVVDHKGDIIPYPIFKGLREGLSSVDYLVSTYGARKGIIDGALKTARAGYITRRLAFLSKEIILKDISCTKPSAMQIIAPYGLKALNLGNKRVSSAWQCTSKNKLTPYLFSRWNANALLAAFGSSAALLILAARSPIYCRSVYNTCQACYGHDLSKKVFASLGENIGITAAQAIGEPGTQMTLRTFHTGGVFSGFNFQNHRGIEKSGKLRYNLTDKQFFGRAKNGALVVKTKNVRPRIQHSAWSGKRILLEYRPSLYLQNFGEPYIVQQKPLVEEIKPLKTRIIDLKKSKEAKHFGAPYPGYARFAKMLIQSIRINSNSYAKFAKNSGLLLIRKELFFRVPKNYCNSLNFVLTNKKNIVFYKIVSPCRGIFLSYKNSFIIKTKKAFYTIVLSFKKLKTLNSNVMLGYNLLVKPKAYVEANTVIAYICVKYLSDRIAKKRKHSKTSIVANEDMDFFHFYNEEVSTSTSFNKSKNNIIVQGMEPTGASYPMLGKIIKKDGCFFEFQKTAPVFINKNIIISSALKNNKHIEKGLSLMEAPASAEAATDITQALESVEKFLEATNTKKFDHYACNKFAGIRIANGMLFWPVFSFYRAKRVYHSSELCFMLRFQQNFLAGRSAATKSWFFHAFSFIFNKKKCQTLLSLNKKKRFVFPFFNQKKCVSKKPIRYCDGAQDFQRDKIDIIRIYTFTKTLNIKYRKYSDSCYIGLQKLRQILANSLNALYINQGVSLFPHHHEIVAKELMSKVAMAAWFGHTLLFYEIMHISLSSTICDAILSISKKISIAIEPLFFGASRNIKMSESFIASSSYQNARKALLNASIEGQPDWLRGIKEASIIGRSSPSGTSFLSYKKCMDKLLFYKNNL